MRSLYIDCGMGAAGDMLTAALLELFPEKEKIVEELNGLGIPEVEFIQEKSVKCGIVGTYMKVLVYKRFLQRRIADAVSARYSLVPLGIQCDILIGIAHRICERGRKAFVRVPTSESAFGLDRCSKVKGFCLNSIGRGIALA